MIEAHDIYSETNPAFCAAVIATFAENYQSTSSLAPEVALAYLMLPCALSQDLAVAFNGTNKNTTLLDWVTNNPAILVDLAKRVNLTLSITTDAIKFGCMSKMIRLSEDGRIASLKMTLPKSSSAGVVDEARKRAGRLGHWFAATGGPRAVMRTLGVTV